MPICDFYFDYLSPYAYLAACRVEPLLEQYGGSVCFRPVLFPALLDHWGQRGPAEIAPKAQHVLRDCVRHARLLGLPLRPPRYHPFRPLTALRVSLAAEPTARAKVVHTLFALGWGHGGDLGSESEIEAALRRAGLDGAALIETARSEPCKQALRTETEAAIARGVFGIPTLDVSGELFWGFDQLPHVERVLQGRDPLEGVDLGDLRNEGIAAWRRSVPRPERAGG